MSSLAVVKFITSGIFAKVSLLQLLLLLVLLLLEGLFVGSFCYSCIVASHSILLSHT